MKKKSLAIILAAMLMLSAAACGNKAKNESADTGSAVNTEENATEYPKDDEGNYLGTKQTGAVDEVNMSKVKGEKLAETEPQDATLKSGGTIDGIKVSIDDAKLIDTDEGQAVVVSFTFRNDTSNPLSFDGLFDSQATENGVSFIPMAVTGVEGINVNAAVEPIESGKSATVQKTYAYNGEETMDVTVQVYGELDGEMIGKAFKF